MKHNLSIPKRIELAFDSIYLLSALIISLVLLLSKTGAAQQLWGCMGLVLVAGDSFHLVPRILAATSGNPERFRPAMGMGKLVTSITMTLFYLILWHCGLFLFSLTLPAQTILLYLLAALRIVLCLLPRNHWKQGGSGGAISIWRNLPFVLQGLLVLWLYATYGLGLPAIRFVSLAVAVSFACYLPVVLWVDKNPKLGMLMLPKTCAYLWILSIGFWL